MADPAISKAVPRKRVEFIDLLRGWAVIVMIETHVMNATLSQDLMTGGVFQVVKFINGLVAPAFLFASGMAYAVTTRRKLNDYLSLGTPLFKQLGRLLLIFLVGYSLHIPKFNYYHLRYIAGERAWQMFYQVDVLQCIAMSLLLMQILLLLLRTERRLYASLTVLTAGVIFTAPLLWRIDFTTQLPWPIASYLNGLQFSLFPLFPWSGFLFAGSIMGYWYVRAREKESAVGGGEKGSGGVGEGATVRMMRMVAWIALSLVAISVAIKPLAQTIYPPFDYWRSGPSFVLLRLALVMFLGIGMYAFERLKGVSPRSVVTLVGRESLLVYTVHLLLIYGNFGEFTFSNRFGGKFGYLEAMLTVLILWIAMWLLALFWSRTKRQPRLKLAVEAGTLAVLIGFFFLGPMQ